MPEALDFWTVRVFISRQGVLFECLSNAQPPPPFLLFLTPLHARFSVWCSGYCFKRQLLFLVSGKPSSLTSPEMKAKTSRWEYSLKTPSLKKTPIIAFWENYISHASLWSEPRGFLLGSFGERTEEQTVVSERGMWINWVCQEQLIEWLPVYDSTTVTQFVCMITERSVYSAEPMESLYSVQALVLHSCSQIIP